MIECSLSRLNSRQSKEGCEETFLKYVLYAFGNIHVDSNRDGLILFATSVSGAIHVAGEHGLFLVSYDIVIDVFRRYVVIGNVNSLWQTRRVCSTSNPDIA